MMRESEPRINFAHTFDIGLAVFSHLPGTASSDVVPDFGTVDVLATEFAALGRDVEGLAEAVQADAATPTRASYPRRWPRPLLFFNLPCLHDK